MDTWRAVQAVNIRLLGDIEIRGGFVISLPTLYFERTSTFYYPVEYERMEALKRKIERKASYYLISIDGSLRSR